MKKKGRPFSGSSMTCCFCGGVVTVSASVKKRTPSRGFCCSITCRDKLNRSKTYDDENHKKKCAKCQVWLDFSLFGPSNGSRSASKGISLQAYCKGCSAEANKVAARKRNEKRGYVKPDVSDEDRKQRKKEYHARYKKENSARVREWNRARQHRARCGGDFPSPGEMSRMLCRQNGRCAYCGELLAGGKHVDHMTPVSRGGTNNASNLQFLCVQCNLKKGTRTHDEYWSLIGSPDRPEQEVGIPSWFDIDGFVRAMEEGDFLSATSFFAQPHSGAMTIAKLQEAA